MDGPFFGRVSEMARLNAAMEGAWDGGRAVVLTGDAGVGKTRLLSVFTERAASAGCVVLRGNCLEVGDSWPYYPLQQALHRSSIESAGTSTGEAARDLLGILDHFKEDGTSGRLLERLHYGLVELAAEHPLLLVLDDLQWIDSSTRRLMLTLLSGLTAGRLLVLGAVRTDDLAASSPVRGLLRELQRARSTEVLEVAPLDRVSTAQLAEAVARRPLSAEDIEAIWRLGGGNPFVVEELVQSGNGHGEAIPSTLREMVLSRVEVLSTLGRDVLCAVSIGVGPVQHDLLARVFSRSGKDLIPAIREGVASQLLVADARGYTLRHRLVQEALEADLLPAERVELHRSFADALTKLGGKDRPDQLAYHWSNADDPVRALPAIAQAAEHAERLHASAEAWQHWQLAVDIAGSLAAGTDLPHLLGRAAEAAHVAGEHAAALGLIDQLEDLTRTETTLRLDSVGQSGSLDARRARYLAAAGRIDAAAQVYNRMLTLPDLGAEQRADAAARSAELLVQLGRYTAAADRAQLALHLTKDLPEAAVIKVIAGAALGFSQAYRGDPHGGRSAVQQALTVAEAAGHPDIIGTAYLHLAELQLTGSPAEIEEGVAVARRGAARVAEKGSRRTHGTALLAAAANGLFRLGRWEEAAGATSQALKADPTGRAAADLLLARARIVMALGDFAATERDLCSAETLLADGGGNRQLVPLATLRAGLSIWLRNPIQARTAVQDGLRAAGDDFGDIGMLAALIWHGIRAEAEAAADGLAIDHQALALLRNTASKLTTPADRSPTRPQDTVQGYDLLNAAEQTRINGQSEPTAWRRAADAWDKRAQPYPAAYARFHLAEALFSQRARNHEASDALRTAHRTAQSLSARPLAAQIEALAARARVQLSEQPDHSTPDPAKTRSSREPLTALTVRELEVLAEIAAGHSDREIGKHLFISQRTVGVHVSRILSKIHARSRVDAATTYLRHQQTGGT